VFVGSSPTRTTDCRLSLRESSASFAGRKGTNDVVRKLVQRRNLNLRDCGFESRLRHSVIIWVDWTCESKLSVKQSLLDEQWRFDSFSAHCKLVGAALTFIRSVTRFDSGACNLRVSECSAEPHKLGRPGATPGPAIDCRLSLRERIDSSCYFRGAKGNYGRVRKLAKRLGRDPRDFAGSTPVSTTLLEPIAWSSG
jgi:hypothetical protein